MILELKEVQVYNNGNALFDTINLEIKPGEVATIMGPSGCGKSTLLSAVCGNLSENFRLEGDILLNGSSIKTIAMEKRQIGLLFQDDLLFPHMDIGDNLAFALPQGLSRQERKDRINSALENAGLSGFEKRDPATLSGGQRARVSLIRSLLAEPKALMLDEPFSSLDQQLRDQIRKFVFEQIKRMNIPSLLVTHDPNDCPGGQMIDLSHIRKRHAG